jgi:hypothetical protein
VSGQTGLKERQPPFHFKQLTWSASQRCGPTRGTRSQPFRFYRRDLTMVWPKPHLSFISSLRLIGPPMCSLEAPSALRKCLSGAPRAAGTTGGSSTSSSAPQLNKLSGVPKDARGKRRHVTSAKTFAIYPAPEVGDVLWPETQQVATTLDGGDTLPVGNCTGGGLPQNAPADSTAPTTGAPSTTASCATSSSSPRTEQIANRGATRAPDDPAP